MEHRNKVYWAAREKAIMFYPKFRIYEFPEGEETFQCLSNLVAGRVFYLEPNKMLHSLILDEDGKIVDIVYVMMFEDKFWLLTSYDNPKVKSYIEKVMSGVEITELTDEWKIVGIEGPYSWRVVKSIISWDIVGLPYLRFLESQIGDNEVVVTRSGITGEYGYRIFVRKEALEQALQKISEFEEFDLAEVTEDIYDEMFHLLSAEVRFPTYGYMVDSGGSPIAYELRWMIDFRKESYLGKEKIEKMKFEYEKRLVGIVCEEKDLSEDEVKNIVQHGKIYIEDLRVGEVKKFLYSLKLGRYIGFGLFNKEWGYAGISEYYIKINDRKINMKTVSTPFFVTESNNVTIE